MPLYSFYPYSQDGLSNCFATLELTNDTEAMVRLIYALDQYESAAGVVVWCGGRKVATHHSVHPELCVDAADHSIKPINPRAGRVAAARSRAPNARIRLRPLVRKRRLGIS